MATTTSIASSSMQGLATCSNFCIQNQWNCQKRRKSRASTSLAFFSPLHQVRHSQCVWLMGVCMKSRFLAVKAIEEDDRPSEDDSEEESSSDDNSEQVDGELFRKRLENIIGDDGDAKFSGKDLAMLIRNKYGRSYDVQLIKKDFMGRKLLAMNVMWKYREQRSFPLTEEEYLLRLDDVANNLKCWGAVSYVRNSLAKTKERPRIGKEDVLMSGYTDDLLEEGFDHTDSLMRLKQEYVFANEWNAQMIRGF